MPLGRGQIFAGYRILRLLGSGGMGEVYLAQHPRLPKKVALKILNADVSGNADYRTRFTYEAELASELDHPNIVDVYDRNEEDGQLWISMSYVDGLDAAHLLTNKFPSGMPPQEVVKIVTAVASALDYAHDRGLLHRDVKPANIMIANDEQRILLADFGIARSLKDTRSLTAKGFVVATVPYAAPEQLKGQEIDGRADQYALAKTAYELLTGSQLFPHSLAEKPVGHAAFDAVLGIAMAEKPEDRFSSCTEFAQALTLAHRRAWAVSSGATLHPIPNAEGGPHQASDRTTRPTTSEIPKPSQDDSVYIPYGRDVNGRRARGPITIGIAMVLFLLAIAFFVRPWQHEDRSRSGNASTPISPAPTITFEGMRDFVEGYYQDLPTHPEAAWAKLDAHCQNQTGLQDYLDFWATIESVTVVSISPRDDASVIAQLKYVRRDGNTDTENRWFRMALVNGTMLLDESDRAMSVPPAPPVTASTGPAPTATQIVTAVAVVNGQPANGYREAYNDPSNTLIACDFTSPAALSPDIYSCAPFAAGADVCWPSPPTTMLCLVDHDPWDKALHRFMWDTAALPPVTPPAEAAPFAVLLDDGTRCKYFYKSLGERDDGYYGMYGCGKVDALLAKQAGNPIDRSKALWTVKVGQVGGQTSHFAPPQTHTVTTAWFAGT